MRRASVRPALKNGKGSEHAKGAKLCPYGQVRARAARQRAEQPRPRGALRRRRRRRRRRRAGGEEAAKEGLFVRHNLA